MAFLFNVDILENSEPLAFGIGSYPRAPSTRISKFYDSCRKVTRLGVTGPIPDELWSLIYVFDLNLANNVLTGPISPSVGNLTLMKWL
ncbi:hypothetical protein SAY87_021914 [Trapa incisa]|uniref:Uncharacterized protein n=1 Tax=Trapa incisa TaxID=236973 RepID=A0AAN7JT44_9MYRT|nr:hypothetical protein SAY87_021914 [Trapa incisa]